MKKIVIAMVTVLAAPFVLSGCGGWSDDPEVLAAWAWFGDRDNPRVLCYGFEQEETEYNIVRAVALNANISNSAAKTALEELC